MASFGVRDKAVVLSVGSLWSVDVSRRDCAHPCACARLWITRR